MKKITLTILATILLFSFGCSKKPQTIEEKAKAEVQSFYDAIDEGVVLTYLYNSDYVEDREFLNQIVNIIAKNLDEDIYNQGAITLRSLCEVADIQAENIAFFILLENAPDESKNDEEVLAVMKKQAEINASQIKQIANIVSLISHTKFETLHKHDAFEQIISKADKPTSAFVANSLKILKLPVSTDSFKYTKLNDTSVKIELKETEQKNIMGTNFFESFLLKQNGVKWEFYDSTNNQIIFKFDQKSKDECFKKIASTLYFDSVSPEGQIDKAKKIQLFKMLDESLNPLKEEMEYEDFELSLSQLILFLFTLDSI